MQDFKSGTGRYWKDLMKYAAIGLNKCYQVSGKGVWHTCAKGPQKKQLPYWICWVRGSKAVSWEIDCLWNNKRCFCWESNYTKPIPSEKSSTSFQQRQKVGVSGTKGRQREGGKKGTSKAHKGSFRNMKPSATSGVRVIWRAHLENSHGWIVSLPHGLHFQRAGLKTERFMKWWVFTEQSFKKLPMWPTHTDGNCLLAMATGYKRDGVLVFKDRNLPGETDVQTVLN